MKENWSIGWDIMQNHSNNHNESHSMILGSDGTLHCNKCGWIVIYLKGELVELSGESEIAHGGLFYNGQWVSGYKTGKDCTIAAMIIKQYNDNLK